MRTIYQHLNVANYACERVELLPLDWTTARPLAVCFDGPCGGDIVIPWQNACEYWRKTGAPVTGVHMVEAGAGIHYSGGHKMFKTFAQWKGFCAKHDGVVTTWTVTVGTSHVPALRVEIGAPYLQHDEYQELLNA